jgi:hypothetical protein
MIDQSGVVAAAVAVNTSLLVEREEKSVVPSHFLVIVTPISFRVRDSLARVLDYSLARTDSPRREYSPPLYVRSSNLVQATRSFSVAARHAAYSL